VGDYEVQQENQYEYQYKTKFKTKSWERKEELDAADRSNNKHYLPGPRRFFWRRNASPTSGTLKADTTEDVSGLGRNTRPILLTIALSVSMMPLWSFSLSQGKRGVFEPIFDFS